MFSIGYLLYLFSQVRKCRRCDSKEPKIIFGTFATQSGGFASNVRKNLCHEMAHLLFNGFLKIDLMDACLAYWSERRFRNL